MAARGTARNDLGVMYSNGQGVTLVAKTADTMKAAEAYMKAVTARGGTNIHDALLEALRPEPADESDAVSRPSLQ